MFVVYAHHFGDDDNTWGDINYGSSGMTPTDLEWLVDLVRAAADARGVVLASTESADPGADFPRLRGFREGDSFRGVLAIRD